MMSTVKPDLKPSMMDRIIDKHLATKTKEPTQIYRFLRTRNQMSPIFLNRNLTYMRQRMSRNHKSRRELNISTIVDKLKAKKEEELHSMLRSYMTLTFLGFYNKRLDAPQESVKVETFLLKISHKKRKDVSSPCTQYSLGVCEVLTNPSESQPPPKAMSLSIPTEAFSLQNGNQVAKTYMLLLRVYCTANNCFVSNNSDTDEAPHKRRKLSNCSALKIEDGKVYGSELCAYDKHNRCLLTDGEYELGLQEVIANVRSSPKKCSAWESIPDTKDCDSFDVSKHGPTLKLKLSWTSEPSNGFVDRPVPISALPNADNKENRPGNNGLDRSLTNHNNNVTNNNNNTSLSNSLGQTKLSTENVEQKGKFQQIVYQFLYHNNSRQQTEACPDMHCPWCSLDCSTLYSLLKHLKLCHSRFTFTYVPISEGARIDVAINDRYDGSYCGSPHELITQPINQTKTGPTRRTSVTNILVCRPKRPKPSLSEFLELDENEFENSRPYITGHNRLYHHTVTMLPIYPKELDNDSECENDPKWLKAKTVMMIDDFTDVNEGEKEFMKMWNLHVMKYAYVGDCQIHLACQMFIEQRGKELIMKNLYRNFVLHLCNLFDFGLLSPVLLYQTIQKLQDMIKEEGEDGEARKVLQKSHAAQVEWWNENGSQIEKKKTVTNTQLSKVNFGHHDSHRRKTTLPMVSPPSSNMHSHVNAKHPSMMSSSTNAFGNLHPPVVTKDASTSGESSRRKTVTEQELNKTIIQRRKSMPTNNSDNDHTRRKLFDPLPNGTAIKTSQNGTLF